MKRFSSGWILAAILLFSLCLCSCADKSPAGTGSREKEDEAMTITKEYILNHTNLTEAELEGLDLEDLVSRFKLTPERLEEYDLEMLIALYKNMLSQPQTTDYTYVYASAEGGIGEQELGSVKVLLFEYHDGNYNECMVVDREAKAVYYGPGLFPDACGESSRVADFREEDAAFLEKALRDSGIASWHSEYKGTSEGTTGSFSWAIGIQLTDGRCFRYSGEGVLDSGTPETMRPMMEALIDRFTAS